MEQSRRRRKKNVYVEYDYEEAYQKQIENLEEDIIKRMMDGKAECRVESCKLFGRGNRQREPRVCASTSKGP